jgi:hypothetical protein
MNSLAALERTSEATEINASTHGNSNIRKRQNNLHVSTSITNPALPVNQIESSCPSKRPRRWPILDADTVGLAALQ